MAALATVRRFLWLGAVALGFAFIIAGAYMVSQGLSAKDQVHDTLVAERITTSEDASIPKAPVDDAATAESQADIIQAHTLEITEGRPYAQLGRFLAADGGDTSDPEKALKGADDKPVPNPVRNTVIQSVSLRTALNLAVMGFKVSDLVIGMGAFIIVVGATNVLLTAPLLYWLREGETAPAPERKRKVGPAAPFPTG